MRKSVGKKLNTMIIARALMAITLGVFWIMAGELTGYAVTGFVLGVLAAAVIFVWTYPGFIGTTDTRPK